MPVEMHLELFKCLDEAQSVCVGLTCRKLYSLHYSIHGKVELHYHRYYIGGGVYMRLTEDADGNAHYLAVLIRDWMGPEYFYPFCARCFERTEKDKAIGIRWL